LAGGWNDVKVIVKRPDPVDPEGPCAGITPEDDIKTVSLPSGNKFICMLVKMLIVCIYVLGSRSVAVYPPACFEAGKPYQVVLQFRRHDPQIDSPTASILVDSVFIFY